MLAFLLVLNHIPSFKFFHGIGLWRSVLILRYCFGVYLQFNTPRVMEIGGVFFSRMLKLFGRWYLI